MNNNDAINALLELMIRLRDPETGCPWDVEQNFKTIAPYTIEEAYEVADAIERENMDDLRDELGDLLLQVVFHSQIAKEKGLFAFADVATHVTSKMIHRHPHVFGDEQAENARDVENRIWEERKAAESGKQALDSVLDDVPRNLPSLIRAQKLQKRAARVGFEWDHAADVLDKMEEEIAEMREAIAGGRQEEILDELGDLFFVLTNFGRMLGVNCEESLRHANHKFERRFKGMESDFKSKNQKMEDLSLDEMEAGWQAQKLKEKKSAA
ncbi:MAG: nucleoside triphosphate pyrophosphohydrolase [Rhodospirillales bacterium]|nr:nucleoside triphosphate pyrophosphohydrolase [Rhodospirillales bacterium]